MNAPARRFSLTRILTAAPEPAAVEPASAPAAPEVEAPPKPEPPKPRELSAARPPEAEEKHPKKKRSYSVDMGVCDDLEVLAWYLGRSSSSVVEELVRRYLSHHRATLDKARDIRRESRKA